MLLWTTDYWDGAISGVCLYQYRKHYFCAEKTSVPLRQRKFIVYGLTDQQIVDETYRHDKFVEYCGLHTNFYPGSTIRMLSEKMESDETLNWKDFYKINFPKLNLETLPQKGYFRL